MFYYLVLQSYKFFLIWIFSFVFSSLRFSNAEFFNFFSPTSLFSHNFQGHRFNFKLFFCFFCRYLLTRLLYRNCACFWYFLSSIRPHVDVVQRRADGEVEEDERGGKKGGSVFSFESTTNCLVVDPSWSFSHLLRCLLSSFAFLFLIN